MDLVRAEGNLQFQRALHHVYVITIVNILLENLDQLDFFQEITEIVQSCVGKNPPDLQEKLQSVGMMHEETDQDGNIVLPGYVSQMITTVEKFYRQSNETIRDQRGAIVELLGYKIVQTRYSQAGECANSRRFVDREGKVITIQEMDVAALCHTRRQCEVYECKMRSNKLERDDCHDLTAVAEAARQIGYRANVGVISFDNDKLIRRHLMRLGASPSIKAYGVESIGALRYPPFEENSSV
jgi:hypothetical protein